MTPYKLYITTDPADSAAPSTDGVAVSGTDTYYSKMWGGEDATYYGLHLRWTGTPTGTFTLWQSDVPEPSEADDTDWVQDTAWTPTNPAGSASKFHDDASNAPAHRKRLKYVNASGSGTLYGYVTTKE